MPLKFTLLTSDPLSGANANPLNSAFWTQVTISGDVLEIHSHQCTTTISFGGTGGSVNSAITWPDDQWAEIQINSLLDDETNFALYVRAASDLTAGYFVSANGPFNDTTGDSTISVGNQATGYLWMVDQPMTIRKGDSFRIGAIGTTLVVFYNGELFLTGDLTADSGGVTASGSPAILLQDITGSPAVGDVGVINFAGGSLTEEETVPAFMTSPFSQRVAMLPGIPFYSFGSFDDRTPPSRMQITSVAITSNVATVGVQLLEGLIPVPGALISIQGVTVLGSLFDVTNVALASVSINSTTGAGSVTFALTHADVATTTAAGAALVPQAEVADVFASGSGLQGAVPFQSGLEDSGKTISWWYNVSGSPSGGTVALQGADIDEDAYYETIDSIDASMTQQGTRNVSPPQNFNFLRINVSGAEGGTNPTIIAGFEV